jgi:hypothetical protein
MSLTKPNRGQDASRIDLHEDYEARFWTDVLGVTRVELEHGVQESGSSVSAVRRELAKAKA